MPLAPVDNKGTQLFYLDIGAPAGSTNYKTLVLIHGAIFNGAIFQRLNQYAAANNLRLVYLNQRDVSGSTPFTPEDLAIVKDVKNKEAQDAFLQDRVKEFVEFMRWFVETEKIPRRNDQEGTGGISLFGWSAGNCFTVPFLGMVETYSPEAVNVLNDYLRNVIVFDSPYFGFGLPTPTIEDMYCPVFDPKLTEAEQNAQFPAWNASYWDHSPSLLSSFSSTSSSSFPTRPEMLSLLAKSPSTKPGHTCTLHVIPPETLKEVADFAASERSILPIAYMNQEVYKKWADKAFLEPPVGWKDVRFEVVTNGKTMNHCLGANWELKKHILENEDVRKKVGARDVEFTVLEEYNHYPHWDHPEAFTKILASKA
ncbi:hypothetical protein C8Q75DRAFT_894788 [Abortiporus biennis]|nr:hypothetical protein C8Q75DRAFT_894788 [Abortiporus biennis]